MNHKLLERLEQIRNSEVPYKITAGNHISSAEKKDICGFLDGIPEVAGSAYNDTFRLKYITEYEGNEKAKKVTRYSRIFANALGKPERTDLFIHKYSETDTTCRIRSENLEEHWIYDPESGFTHIFVLPARKLINESERKPEPEKKPEPLIILPSKKGENEKGDYDKPEPALTAVTKSEENEQPCHKGQGI